MARQDLEFIASALGDAVESAHYSTRLQHGTRLRTALYMAMAKGAQVDHYRIKWLGASATRILDFARGLCREFDAAHPDDMASAFDLGDILRIASTHINGSLPEETLPEPDAPSGTPKNDTPS